MLPRGGASMRRITTEPDETMRDAPGHDSVLRIACGGHLSLLFIGGKPSSVKTRRVVESTDVGVVLLADHSVDMALSILKACPSVDFCVGWSTALHEDAAQLFIAHFRQMLTTTCWTPSCAAAANRAFHAARALLLQEVQFGRASSSGAAGVPVGTPLYAFADPKTAPTCTPTHAQEPPPIAVGCPLLLHRAACRGPIDESLPSRPSDQPAVGE